MTGGTQQLPPPQTTFLMGSWRFSLVLSSEQKESAHSTLQHLVSGSKKLHPWVRHHPSAPAMADIGHDHCSAQNLCPSICPPSSEDPQQRLLLECTSEVLLGFRVSVPTDRLDSEDRQQGWAPGHPQHSRSTFKITGAFVGASSTDYNKLALRYGTVGGERIGADRDGGASLAREFGMKGGGGGVSAFSATGASLSVAAGRLAFTFDLHGPVMTIDTGE